MKSTILLLVAISLFLSMPAFCHIGINGKKSGDKSIGNSPGYSAGDKTNLSYTSKAFYLNVVPSSSYVFNKDIYNSDNWNPKNGFGVNFEVGYFGKFSRIIGYGFGLGYSSFSTEITSAPQEGTASESDIDSDEYTQLIQTSEITEKTKLGYFDIPIFIEFSTINIDKIGFYGRAGLKLSIPLSKTFTSSGQASYEGYYDQYNVVLYGIPELGFDNDKPIYSNTEMTLKPINVSALLSAGITYPLSNYLILRLGANANFGLLEISDKKASDYNSTMVDGNYNKLLENPNSTTVTKAFGIEVGIIYNLRLY